MKAYQRNKESTSKWVGLIPEHWECIRLGMLGKFTSSGIDKKLNDDEPSVNMVNYTDIVQSRKYFPAQTGEKEYMVVTTPESKLREHSLVKGDMVFIPSSETIEDLGYSSLIDFEPENTVYSYHILRYRSDSRLTHDFKKYVVNNNSLLSYFSSEGKGTTRQIIGRGVFNNARIPLPPPEEQTQIARYLDYKTDRIDALIAKKQRLIELLEEERTAIINQAVTKGLDSNAAMKDSGIEWLGEIPEHWEVKRLRYLGKCQNGISAGAEYFGSGYPFVSYGNVYNNDVLPKKVEGLANSSKKDQAHYSVKSGDVFFTRTSETVDEIGIASTCFEDFEQAVFAGFLIRFRPNNYTLIKEFSRFFFNSIIPRVFFVKEMNLVTRASLSQELLKRLPVLLPPLEEQREIGNFLELETNRIETTIEHSRKSIELLKEYKTALISEVVTGKVDVRDEVIPE